MTDCMTTAIISKHMRDPIYVGCDNTLFFMKEHVLSRNPKVHLVKTLNQGIPLVTVVWGMWVRDKSNICLHDLGSVTAAEGRERMCTMIQTIPSRKPVDGGPWQKPVFVPPKPLLDNCLYRCANQHHRPMIGLWSTPAVNTLTFLNEGVMHELNMESWPGQ